MAEDAHFELKDASAEERATLGEATHGRVYDTIRRVVRSPKEERAAKLAWAQQKHHRRVEEVVRVGNQVYIVTYKGNTE